MAPEEELFELTQIRPGDVFSRREITETSTAIADRLGEDGYAFANLNGFTELSYEEGITDTRDWALARLATDQSRVN